MKSLKLTRIAAIALATFGSAAALADTTTLNVSATVTNVCRIYSAATGTTLIGAGGLSMSFGAIDPTGSAAYNPTTTMYYRCNVTSAPTLTVGSGAGASTSGTYSGVLTGPGSSTMAYQITWTAPAGSTGGLGAVNAQSVVFTGDLQSAAYANKPAGAYSEAVQVTVAP